MQSGVTPHQAKDGHGLLDLDNWPMGILYVVGAPVGAPDDITLRALRVLAESTIIVVDVSGAVVDDQVGAAHRLLGRHGIVAPLVPSTAWQPAMECLASGDAVLLLIDWSPVPRAHGQRLVQAAREAGFPVVPIPGPSLPVAALVVSGLPTDRFSYLGAIPEEPAESRAVWAAMASEEMTLVALASHRSLPAAFELARESLGKRSVILLGAAEAGMEAVWTGTLAESPQLPQSISVQDTLVLIIAGTENLQAPWTEERLESAIAAALAQGLGAKEVGRTLALESGWPRREIYRRTVGLAKSTPRHSG